VLHRWPSIDSDLPWSFAGGLNPALLASGDVVVSPGTFQHDLGEISGGKVKIWAPETPLGRPYSSDMFLTPPYLVQAALRAIKDVAFTPWKLPASCVCENDGRPKPECRGEPMVIGRPKPKICSGVIATGDTFIADAALAVALSDGRKAVAVDMETAAVAQEATDVIPFLAVRVIGDGRARGRRVSLLLFEADGQPPPRFRHGQGHSCR
jgi:nucleoside phosphorylase